jgi:hypothetical protein
VEKLKINQVFQEMKQTKDNATLKIKVSEETGKKD